MQTLQQAKNGQALLLIKELKELSTVERENLILPSGDQLTDYSSFQVRYNKKGQLLGIKPYTYTVEKAKKIRSDAYNNVGILDELLTNYETITGIKPWSTIDTKGAKNMVHYAKANKAIKERQEKAKAKKRELKKCN